MKTKDLNKKLIVHDSRCQPSCTCDVAFSSVDRGATYRCLFSPLNPTALKPNGNAFTQAGLSQAKPHPRACMYVARARFFLAPPLSGFLLLQSVLESRPAGS